MSERAFPERAFLEKHPGNTLKTYPEREKHPESTLKIA